MNLVPLMNVNSFNKSMGEIISSYKQCAEDSMNSAAENVRKMNNEITVANEKIVDIVVSSDGAYVQRNVLEMGVASAAINFNDRNCDILNVFTDAGMQAGCFTKMFCLKKDESQMQRMDKKTNETTTKKT